MVEGDVRRCYVDNGGVGEGDLSRQRDGVDLASVIDFRNDDAVA